MTGYREILASRPTVDRMGRPIRWTDPYERLMEKVEPEGDCVVYVGKRRSRPTTHVRIGVQGAPGGKIGAHRIAWEHHNGPIPDGLIVRHKCDNPPCVKIEHLELGTHQDNFDDARNRGRWTPTPPDKNNRSTMTRETVREMRRLRREGARIVDLAKKYGIAYRTAQGILGGDRWAWLEDDTEDVA